MFEYIERQRDAQMRMADATPYKAWSPCEDTLHQDMHCPVCASRLVAGDWMYVNTLARSGGALGCCECCEIGDDGGLLEKESGAVIADAEDFDNYFLEG